MKSLCLIHLFTVMKFEQIVELSFSYANDNVFVAPKGKFHVKIMR